MEESIKAEFKQFLNKLEMPKDGRVMLQRRRFAVKDLISVVQMLKYSAENMSDATVGAVLTRVGGLIASKELEDLNATGEELVKSCLRNLSVKGWGMFTANPSIDGNDVVLKNSAIAEEYPSRRSKVDYIAVGIISSVYQKAFNRRYMVKEELCIARGDEICKFTVKPI